MATKDYLSISNDKQKSFVNIDNDGQYSNLNLNQNHTSSYISPIQSHGKSLNNNNKNADKKDYGSKALLKKYRRTPASFALSAFAYMDNYKGNRNFQSWKNSDNPPLNVSTYYDSDDYKVEKEWLKNNDSSNINSSTLSTPVDSEIIYDCIQFVTEDLIEYVKKKFGPFLEGGQFYSPTEDLRIVPRSNRKCESIFGLIDSDYAIAPNKRIARRDVKVQAKVNDVFE